ncbi:MAG: ribosomal protein [Candidatus Krumholzibacteriota bacterium]|jgi:large subunit ribosomal protein L21|nr:ribosomal protein [Candidatus Krumholzibacteriota bacterium]
MEQYAVVEVLGCQLKVTANTVVRIPKADAEVGAELSFDKVMLVSDGQKIEVGKPYLEGKAVRAEVIRHGKGEKIRIFKKKRRKTYRKTTGHRQQFTEVRIKEIGGR